MNIASFDSNRMFLGVVEDRHDPEQMGRVRVRVFALHNVDRKEAIPIDALPWSLVLHSPHVPTAAANVHSLKEGTWVIVVYLDEFFQESLVIGSIPSRYEDPPAETEGEMAAMSAGGGSKDVNINYDEGLTDPFGVYPRFADDTSLVTRETEWTKHPSYHEREEWRLEDIPTAKRARDGNGDRKLWDEPPLRGGQESFYPYNSVREFESGCIEEYDSTPDNSRVTRMHRSGTYDEILHDGSRTLKIRGKSYVITLDDHQMYIAGDLDVTVGGDMRQYVRGDYILEVNGDWHVTVGNSRFTNINVDDIKDILGNEITSVRYDHLHRCDGYRKFLSVLDTEHISHERFFIEAVREVEIESLREHIHLTAMRNIEALSRQNDIILDANRNLIGKARRDTIILDANRDLIGKAGRNIDLRAQIDVDITAGQDVTVKGNYIYLN